jgi:Flp pilus assembly protein TadD
MGNLPRKRRKQRQRARRLGAGAWEAAERSDWTEAEGLLRKALRSSPGDPVLWNDLGLVLWKAGNLREAEKALESALLVRPGDEEAKMNLASLLAARGFYRQALRHEEEMAARTSGPRREFHEKRAAEWREAAERVSKERDAAEEQEGQEGEAAAP